MSYEGSKLPFGAAFAEYPIGESPDLDEHMRPINITDAVGEDDHAWTLNIKCPIRKSVLHGAFTQSCLHGVFDDNVHTLQIYMYHRLINSKPSDLEIISEYKGFAFYIETDEGRKARIAREGPYKPEEKEDYPF